MKDPLWEEVYQALLRVIRPDDVVLLPTGDWPPLPCGHFFYNDLISIGDATVFILHKGRFGSLAKPTLASIAETWQCIFGNEVFLCFSKHHRLHRDLRRGRHALDFRVLRRGFPANDLRRFLRTKKLRRRVARIWYVHLPKAAGTSMWQSLSRVFPSRIYYPTLTPFTVYPPAIDEYDLIGGHLPVSLILGYVRPEDRVVGLMRDPTERLLSAFLHSRRNAEDPMTFTPTMRAMREQPFSHFIRSKEGKLEARQQLLMLGHVGEAGGQSVDDYTLLDNAQNILSDNRFVFSTCGLTHEFLRFVVPDNHRKFQHLRPVNFTERITQASDIEEFNEVRDQVLIENAAERRLYDFVAQRFRRIVPATAINGSGRVAKSEQA